MWGFHILDSSLVVGFQTTCFSCSEVYMTLVALKLLIVKGLHERKKFVFGILFSERCW